MGVWTTGLGLDHTDPCFHYLGEADDDDDKDDEGHDDHHDEHFLGVNTEDAYRYIYGSFQHWNKDK